MNRLKLDFSLETAQERKEFIDTYIVQSIYHSSFYLK